MQMFNKQRKKVTLGILGVEVSDVLTYICDKELTKIYVIKVNLYFK